MKKSFALILISLLMLCFTAHATPQTIDLETMSYAELFELSQSVEQAMMNFQEWKGVMVPEGKYVVGTDIPEGSYLVSLGSADFGVNVYIYETENGINRNSDEESIKLIPFQEGDEIYVKLISGNSIALYYGSLYFKPFTLGF